MRARETSSFGRAINWFAIGITLTAWQWGCFPENKIVVIMIISLGKEW